MKVLVLSQYYDPEPVPIPRAVAQDLSKAGHQVRVLTGFPNYPTGHVYPGYRLKWRQEEKDGEVRVLRVPLWPDHSGNALPRLLNYASFSLASASAWRFAQGADVIYVYATQMTAAFSPWLWRRLGGSPYVLHIQDLWPDSVTGSTLLNRESLARAVDRALTPWLSSVYSHAAGIIGIAPTMVDTLLERGAAPDTTHLLYNWAETTTDMGHLIPPATPTEGDSTHAVFAGNVGDMQDLETAVEAAHQVQDSGFHLTIVGDGVALPRVRERAERLGATNVSFTGRVPRNQMPEIYRCADFALITLKDLEAFRGTIPSKFQASLSYGLPVITTVKGDLRSLVIDRSLGLIADPQSATDLAATFRKAASVSRAEHTRLSANCRETYTDLFEREAATRAMEVILRDVVAGTSRLAPHCNALKSIRTRSTAGGTTDRTHLGPTTPRDGSRSS